MNFVIFSLEERNSSKMNKAVLAYPNVYSQALKGC
jgi:hypothetical protein